MSLRGVGRTPAEETRLRRLIARLQANPDWVSDTGAIQLQNGVLALILDGAGLNVTDDGLDLVLSEVMVFNETPTGAINGVNDTFTTANDTVPGTLRVYLNGVFMVPDEDYDRIGADTIQFNASQIPQTGDRVAVHYEKDA